MDNARKKWPDLTYAATALEAATDADLVMVLTEWPEYVGLEPADLSDVVRGRRIIDGRNCLQPATWRSAGWTYRALGRP